MQYPLQNAARIALHDVTDAQHELRKAEYDLSLERGVLQYDVAIESLPSPPPPATSKGRHASITVHRLIKDGPTPGCSGCTNGTSNHNKACRKRFDELYPSEVTS